MEHSKNGVAIVSCRGAVCAVSRRIILFLLATVLLSPYGAAEQKNDDLTSKSIEDLMNMEITSVSKKAERLSRTPAAVFVITSEDIRRSGARNIPDLLRMVPGVDVAQINANTWAISARGLNEEFGDKLLVLIDGRSVYTPTFGGVLWETVSMPLEDIERIEVIRGPGGAIWGANAVNGVINIITKKASETRGGMIVAGGGTLEHGFGTAQYGASLGTNAAGRAYVQYENHDHLSGISGQAANDSWDAVRGGFRIDDSPSTRDTVTLQGDMYNGQEGQDVLTLATLATNPERGTIRGGYLQSIWNRKYSERADSSLQISFDRYVRSLPFTDHRNTLDATYQYHFALDSRQDIVAGAEYRLTNHMSNSATVTYSAADNTRELFGAFVQDEIEIVPDHLYFTMGVKMEHNDYTGFEAMPDARMEWEATQRDMFWAAVSRAERTPTSGDTSDHVDGGEAPGPGGIPLHLVVDGNPNFTNETLLAYQAGYRGIRSSKFSVDVSTFYNIYRHLRTFEPSSYVFQPLPSPQFLETLVFGNGIFGETHGVEFSGNWKATSRWTLSPGYAFEAFHMRLNPDSQGTTLLPTAQGGSPQHSAQLRSHLALAKGFEWNASAYFVGRLQELSIPSYTRVDTELTWRIAERGSFSVVGQNLVQDHHPETSNATGLIQPDFVKRSVYAKIDWRF
jgi:iron complex outermembrane receptor protein